MEPSDTPDRHCEPSSREGKPVSPPAGCQALGAGDAGQVSPATPQPPRLEPIFENGGSAILMSAATFLPSCSISLDLPCKSGRAERGRNPALPRDHLHAQQQMHMIRRYVPSQYLDLVHLADLPYQFPQPHRHLPSHDRSAVLRCEHYVVVQQIHRVRTLPVCRHTSSYRRPPKGFASKARASTLPEDVQ